MSSKSRASSPKQASTKTQSKTQSKSRISEEKITDSPKDLTSKNHIALLVISFLIQSSILYYLYNLEDAECNCIRDWRHNFIKGFSVLVICVSLLGLVISNLLKIKAVMIIYGILSLINYYAFITYIGELNNTKCVCAVVKQPNLNSIMKLYRWLLLIIAVLVIIAVITLLVIGGSIMTAIKK
jgi:hypothetical protein